MEHADRSRGDSASQTEAVYSSEEAVERYGDAAEGGLSVVEERVVDRFFDADAGAVLDVGCGAGRTTCPLAAGGFDVIGIDVSEEMVDETNRRYPALDVRVGDVRDLDFDDDRFAHVLFSYCGIDMIQPEAGRFEALEEIGRVLEPGGTFAFSTHNCLYNIPALLLDRGHIRNMYVENGNWRRLGSQYKVDGREWGLPLYVSSPWRTKRQLDQKGFSFVEYVGERRRPLRYFERRPYYVARNEAEGADSSDPARSGGA